MSLSCKQIFWKILIRRISNQRDEATERKHFLYTQQLFRYLAFISQEALLHMKMRVY